MDSGESASDGASSSSSSSNKAPFEKGRMTADGPVGPRVDIRKRRRVEHDEPTQKDPDDKQGPPVGPKATIAASAARLKAKKLEIAKKKEALDKELEDAEEVHNYVVLASGGVATGTCDVCATRKTVARSVFESNGTVASFRSCASHMHFNPTHQIITWPTADSKDQESIGPQGFCGKDPPRLLGSRQWIEVFLWGGTDAFTYPFYLAVDCKTATFAQLKPHINECQKKVANLFTSCVRDLTKTKQISLGCVVPEHSKSRVGGMRLADQCTTSPETHLELGCWKDEAVIKDKTLYELITAGLNKGPMEKTTGGGWPNVQWPKVKDPTKLKIVKSLELSLYF